MEAEVFRKEFCAKLLIVRAVKRLARDRLTTEAASVYTYSSCVVATAWSGATLVERNNIGHSAASFFDR